MDLIQAMQVSGSALTAQRTKLNVISENLANVETTRTAEGGPYRRKMVVFSQGQKPSFESMLKNEREKIQGVEVSDVIASDENLRTVYDPSHPDADPNTGYVTMPNVDVITEMADMMLARRAYDASVTALGSTKALILRTLEIGK